MKNKSTEVALQNPGVTSHISMNLNQNDIIEVAIQEHLSILETKIDANTALGKQLVERRDAAIKAAKEEIMKKELKSNKDLQKFKKVCEALDIKYEDSSELNFEGENLGIFDHCDFDRAENFKNPIAWVKQNTYKKAYSAGFPTSFRIRLSGSSEDHKFNAEYRSDRNTMTTAQIDKIKKKVMPIYEEMLVAEKEKFELMVKYINFTYGEKRVKSQIIKASLSKSEEGRGILTMLEEATKIKILS